MLYMTQKKMLCQDVLKASCPLSKTHTMGPALLPHQTRIRLLGFPTSTVVTGCKTLKAEWWRPFMILQKSLATGSIISYVVVVVQATNFLQEEIHRYMYSVHVDLIVNNNGHKSYIHVVHVHVAAQILQSTTYKSITCILVQKAQRQTVSLCSRGLPMQSPAKPLLCPQNVCRYHIAR